MTARHRRRALAVAPMIGLIGIVVGVGPHARADVDVEIDVPDGFAVSELVNGLVGPTQLTIADGDFVVAQLAGGEADGTGEVVRIDGDDPSQRVVLYDGLLKPTGVAVLGEELWVMEERTLSRGPLAGGELEAVLTELPYNGRSQGTLTATEDGALLYNTSGTLSGTGAAEGSATLWSITPDGEPAVVATGFKNAYGRTFDDEGTLWQAEMSDGSYDGEQAPDELVVVEPGDDFGWPRCIGDRQPVEFYEGTEELCAATPPSFTLFEPGATPTSVAMAPWDPGVVLVALWNEGRVVAVRGDDEERPAAIDDFLLGIERPQFLLADGDRLLVVDFGGGRILAIEPTT